MRKKPPICDLHCDTVLKLMAGRDLDDASLHVSLPYLREAGIGLQVFACYIPVTVPKEHCFSLAQRMLDSFEQNAALHDQELQICRKSSDIEEARAQGKIAAILAIENGNAIENSLANLEALYARGVRLMTLIHSKSNDWAISSNDPTPRFDGLSSFGADVVTAMDELGMIIDISHAHDRTVERVLNLSRKPVIASHSCVHKLCPVPRNLKDGLIQGLAESGGLVGINMFPGFLDSTYAQAVKARTGDIFSELDKAEEAAGEDMAKLAETFDDSSKRIRRAMQDLRVPLDEYLKHLDYVLDLVGEDFVAFGSDFDGVPDLPGDVEDCRVFARIRDSLLDRGLKATQVKKICWSNFLRIFKAVCG
jgi:membrane dipeptidase